MMVIVHYLCIQMFYESREAIATYLYILKLINNQTTKINEIQTKIRFNQPIAIELNATYITDIYTLHMIQKISIEVVLYQSTITELVYR